MSGSNGKQSCARLHREIKDCTLCAEHLPLGPRPIVQFSTHSRILIIGQAPGTKVHKSGVPWDDDSGNRLREWLGVERETFYDPDNIALIPMGFCYPGKKGSGDAPPRKECAPQWHDRILSGLPKDRLTLLVGSYAQTAYLPDTRKLTLTQRVRNADRYATQEAPVIPLPHPSWRVRMWMEKNAWFERETVPLLQAAVRERLA